MDLAYEFGKEVATTEGVNINAGSKSIKVALKVLKEAME